MLSISSTDFCNRFLVSPNIHDVVCKIHRHLNVTEKIHFNCCLHLAVYDDSIGLTIEDECCTCTFLIDNFADYITIFTSLHCIY